MQHFLISFLYVLLFQHISNLNSTQPTLWTSYFSSRGSLVGWGTMLQVGRSWVRFLMMPLDFLILRNPSIYTMAQGCTHPLTEIFLGGKAWPTLKADNFTAIYELIVKKRPSISCYKDSFTIYLPWWYCCCYCCWS
jgi:hypothetical protein